ncbi:kielin/chordin-like protein [Mytilus trossulus]|uniref:kielin/chordin-like protein n=1 Tax=Mytilus trossulus TaxID=6551 RepID=UPI0030070CBD
MVQKIVFPAYIVVAIYMFSFVGGSFGSEKYGRCIKYRVGESQPVITNGDRECMTRGKHVYCREFTCPTTNCASPTQDGKCSYCTGTCSYGGVVYQVGDGFECLDGSNRCSCSNNNVIGSSAAASNEKLMCKK